MYAGTIPLKKDSAFLEKGRGLGKGKTSFHGKRSFPLPQERSPLIQKQKRKGAVVAHLRGDSGVSSDQTEPFYISI